MSGTGRIRILRIAPSLRNPETKLKTTRAAPPYASSKRREKEGPTMYEDREPAEGNRLPPARKKCKKKK
jgi:hypothetical protein